MSDYPVLSVMTFLPLAGAVVISSFVALTLTSMLTTRPKAGF